MWNADTPFVAARRACRWSSRCPTGTRSRRRTSTTTSSRSSPASERSSAGGGGRGGKPLQRREGSGAAQHDGRSGSQAPAAHQQQLVARFLQQPGRGNFAAAARHQQRTSSGWSPGFSSSPGGAICPAQGLAAAAVQLRGAHTAKLGESAGRKVRVAGTMGAYMGTECAKVNGALLKATYCRTGPC